MEMVKKMVKILLPLSCLLAGLLLASSGFLLAEKIEEKNRFNACREQDYSFLSLTGSDEERFGSLVVRRENGDTLFLDDWSGQMRQYRNGVLFLLSIAEWKEDAGPEYRSYSIRTAEECDALAALFSEGKTDEIKEKGGRIWQTASGETFID